MSLTLLEQITELSKQYALLYRGGDPGELAAIAERVAILASEVPTDAGPEVAELLFGVAKGYSRTGNYPTALALQEKVLEIRRVAFGLEDPWVIQTIHEVGLTYGLMGRYSAAEPLLVQAREIGRRVLGENDRRYAITVDSLGVLYSRMGNFAAAEPLLQQAVTVKRAVFGTEDPSYALSLNNLALLYDRMGRYRESERFYREAIEIARAAFGDTDPRLAQSLSNLAGLYTELGNFAEAERLFRQALDIARTFFGENHPDVALYLGNLASLYDRTGNRSGALRLYRAELQIRERVLEPDDLSIAITLDNMAWLFEQMEDFASAEDYYMRALRIQQKVLAPSHHDLTVTMNDLARFFAVALGDIVRAESMMLNVLAMRRSTLGNDHPDVALSQVDLATLYCMSGKFSMAEPLLRQALSADRARFGEEHPSVARTLHQLSAIAIVAGRKDEALTLTKQATAIDDHMQAHLMAFGSERRRMAYLRSAKSMLFLALSLVQEAFSGEPDNVQWVLELVWKRKAIGAEAVAVQRDAVLGGRYPALQLELQKLFALRAQIARKCMDGPGEEGLGAYRQMLNCWEAERDELEDKLAREIPEMSLDTSLSAANRQVVADALPPGSVLVEFVRFPIFNFQAKSALHEPQWLAAHYVAFVLPAGEPDHVAMIDLGDATAIEELIDAYRATITGEPDEETAWPELSLTHETDATREAVLRASLLECARSLRPRRQVQQNTDFQLGMALRKLVFDRLVPLLNGRTRLILAPDGGLSRLSFEVLPLDNGRFLLDAYVMSYLGVGRDILRFGHCGTGQPAAPLVAADPDYDLHIGKPTAMSPGTPFARLKSASIEGSTVADLLKVRPWLRDQVLETPLKAIRSPRILHIATHGFFIPVPFGSLNTLWSGSWTKDQEEHSLANPLLRSGLVLAGANTWVHKGALPPEAEDGFLTAEDVTVLNLLDTELVVLSACETGLGEVQVGEGVFGLRRAFVMAGAKTLVMSLWKVPDRQTQELMEDFYRRILAGQARSEALREAQLAAKARYPEPLYWGAFICQGNPGPLQGKKPDHA